MAESHSSQADERELTLRYAATCHICSIAIPPRSRAIWDRMSKTARCLSCVVPAQAERRIVDGAAPPLVDFGVAGASAQRLFETKEAKRRARLRANWWLLAILAGVGATVGGFLAHLLHTSVLLFLIVGAALPVLDLIRRPQHINAWRSGASGERVVGKMLDGLRGQGVVAIHDRRVPGRRTNIDHIAISQAGVFVIDTKNAVGKVQASRSGLRVAGRRQEKMLDGVIGQVAVVQHELAQLQGSPVAVHGVLCFTKADLPWLRPEPRGIALLYCRGLRKALTKADAVFSRDQVNMMATELAKRLPPA